KDLALAVAEGAGDDGVTAAARARLGGADTFRMRPTLERRSPYDVDRSLIDMCAGPAPARDGRTAMRPVTTALAAIAAAGMCAGGSPAFAAGHGAPAPQPAPRSGCIDPDVMPPSQISMGSQAVIGTPDALLFAYPACEEPAPPAG
ncbi:hypothetical protein ACFOVU_15835, partial [Nocardiopsis sediminis]